MAIYNPGDKPQTAQSVNIGQFGPSHDSLQDWRSVFQIANQMEVELSTLDATVEEITELKDQTTDLVISANNAVIIAEDINEKTIANVEVKWSEISEMRDEVDADRIAAESAQSQANSAAVDAQSSEEQSAASAQDALITLQRVEEINEDIENINARAEVLGPGQPTARFEAGTNTIVIGIPSTVTATADVVTGVQKVDDAGVPYFAKGDVVLNAADVGALPAEGVDIKFKDKVSFIAAAGKTTEFELNAIEVGGKEQFSIAYKASAGDNNRKGIVMDTLGDVAVGGELYAKNAGASADRKRVVYEDIENFNPTKIGALAKSGGVTTNKEELGYTQGETDTQLDAIRANINTANTNISIKMNKPSGADVNVHYAGKTDGTWEAIQTNPGIPVGSVLAFSGKTAPDGWFELNGQLIYGSNPPSGNISYPDLYRHLVNIRSPGIDGTGKIKTTVPVTYSYSGWAGGLMTTLDNKNAITWLQTSEASTNTEIFFEKYVTPTGNTNVVAKLSFLDKYSLKNASSGTYWVQMVHGTWDEFKALVAGKAVDVYNSIVDIIPNSTSAYMPDARNAFIRGYDRDTGRGVLTPQGDAIRNFTPVFKGNALSDHNHSITLPATAHSGNAAGHPRWAADAAVYFNATATTTSVSSGTPTGKVSGPSEEVPTADENRPYNLNAMWIMKGYDEYRDPAQLSAEEIKDKVIAMEGDRVPVGHISNFYGVKAPLGYLSCDGSRIERTMYPQLVDHLISMRKPGRASVKLSYNGSGWTNGILNNNALNDIDFNTGTSQIINFTGTGITTDGSFDLRYKYVSIGSAIGRLGLVAGKSIYIYQGYSVQMLQGSWSEFAEAAKVSEIHIYNSLTDIPLDNAVYLPDMRGQYISGWDDRDSRFIGIGEGDAIRNITGNIGEFRRVPTAERSAGALYAGGNVRTSNTSTTGESLATDVVLDASRIVPTDSTNHPQNVNFLTIIKAYDTVTNKAELDAQAVVDTIKDMEKGRVPITSVNTFYGKTAPAGWEVCDGKLVNNLEYQSFIDKMIAQRNPKVKTTVPVTSNAGDWTNGLADTWDGLDGQYITWYETSEYETSKYPTYAYKFVTPKGNTSIVASLFEAISSPENFAKDIYAVKMIHGTWEQFKAAVAGKAVDVYESIVDVPVVGGVYVPYMNGMFVRGVEAGGAIGASQGDTIRNITGEYGSTYTEVNGVSNPHAPTLDTCVQYGAFVTGGRPQNYNYRTQGSTGSASRGRSLLFDASRVVPTANEVRPKNISLLWCIKVYDDVRDPEVVSSQAVINHVNSNDARITALEARIVSLVSLLDSK